MQANPRNSTPMVPLPSVQLRNRLGSTFSFANRSVWSNLSAIWGSQLRHSCWRRTPLNLCLRFRCLYKLGIVAACRRLIAVTACMGRHTTYHDYLQQSWQRPQYRTIVPLDQDATSASSATCRPPAFLLPSRLDYERKWHPNQCQARRLQVSIFTSQPSNPGSQSEIPVRASADNKSAQ